MMNTRVFYTFGFKVALLIGIIEMCAYSITADDTNQPEIKTTVAIAPSKSSSYDIINHFKYGPNPFTHPDSIRFTITSKRPFRVSLSIFDLSGNKIVHVSENKTATRIIIFWDGTDQSKRHVSTGTYIAKITSTDSRTGKKDIKKVKIGFKDNNK
jgi:hypothetical protein